MSGKTFHSTVDWASQTLKPVGLRQRTSPARVAGFAPHQRHRKVNKLVLNDTRHIFRASQGNVACESTTASATETALLDLVCFTLIVDDIVFPDGRTEMGLLGGGGPQVLFGYQLSATKLREDPPKVGLFGGVGADLPEKVLQWFVKMGIDTTGLYETIHPTPRAWQINEEDGRRTQVRIVRLTLYTSLWFGIHARIYNQRVWRSIASDELYGMLRPDLSLLPADYRLSHAYHIGINPNNYNLQYLRDVQALARNASRIDFDEVPSRLGLLSIEPFVHAETKLTPEELSNLCAAGDIFTPNELEAFSLVGPGTPLEVIDRIVEAGARGLVVLRRGPDGSVAHDVATGETWQVPAVPGSVVVDPTGCGNAYAGGFLGAWAAGTTLVDAGCWGSVAASFMLEVRGVPEPPLDRFLEEADRRFRITKAGAQCLRPSSR
eukprot:1179093-Prorocentrum_minimum.AAC.3